MGKYTGQVGKFLNDYMHPKRNMGGEEAEQKRILFKTTADCCRRIFPDAPQERLPTAVTEALYVGIMRNVAVAQGMTDEALRERYQKMRTSPPFSEEGLAEGLSKKDKVTGRLNTAIQIFSQ
jgi:hypothetical protein